MKQNNVLFLFFIGLVIVISVLSGPGCANIIPPMGGPRDSLPPELVSAKPPDSAKSFAGKRITFEFNEYVQLENIQENLLVSPVPKINPIVNSRLRTVTVDLKDTLEENTTYSLNFGNAVKDINEGNVFRNFTYIFTTGKELDSLEISGKIIIAETGKSDSTLIAMLHTSTDDSAVIKQRPRYITRSDRNGNFTFHNLPPGTYALYVLKDEGGQHLYLSKSQLFAFADSTVTTQDHPKPVTLYAYTEKEEEKKPAPSVVKPAVRGGTQVRPRLQLETNVSGKELDLLSNLEITFKSAPYKTFDSSKLVFTNEKFEPLTGYRYIKDTSFQKVTLVYKWTPNTTYNLILDKDFAEDTLGNKIPRNDTLTFTTKRENEYGLLRLRLLNLDLSKNPVLQFVSSDVVKFSVSLTTNTYNSKLFQPGDYDLRIVYDENKNGIWDAGEFFGKHRQPEKVLPLSRKLTVKANWDNEVDITLDAPAKQ
jgi:uncharacterized protein (DUF2141 family)